MTEAHGVLIRLAGAFAVERNGVPYPRGAVGGKARALLKLLAAERGGVLAADRVAEELWPGGGPKRPVQNVATLVSRLRGALGAGIVVGGRTGYRLGGAPGVRVDLDLAAELVAEAEGCLAAGEPALAGAAAGRAVELLHDGLVLVGEPDTRWVAAAREEAAGLVRRARHAGARSWLGGADPVRARRAAEAAVRADPFDEVAYRLLMRAHVATGEPAKALLAYERLRGRLVAELGTDPAAETRAVHLAVLREEDGRAELDGLGEGGRLGGRGGLAGPDALGGRGGQARPDGLRGPGRHGGHGGLGGRGAELAVVSGAWARAVSGGTGVLLIAGEAGAGKSRLAAEAERMAGATGGTVLRARCHEIERALFLQPFVDALRPRVAHLAGDVLRGLAGDRAPALESLVRGRSMERRYAYEAVTAFLRALASREPVLLVLEDLHAAGAATVELVHYLARRVSGVRLLIVATALSGEGGVSELLRGVVEVVRPGPLPASVVLELAGDAELAEAVYRRTGGQPQLVAALLAEVEVRERGPAVAEVGECGTAVAELAGGGVGGAGSDAVRAIVLGRLRGLGEPVLRALRAASVVGGAFDPVLLGAVLGLAPQEVAGHCERALSRGLLVVRGSSYEFAEALTRDVLYATTPAPTRAVYERCAAEAQGQVLASASNTAGSLSTGSTHIR
ncbi:DNA-binding SARP family transcriptional activator [Nonomuraea thailandensis]|uniref:DNA-binding SARP family transcriptional activator n=1 Tax=Nonomuraea thailandensis TaxID=1188745 RepID=A0A9X2G911_9ACTN|nr:AAA family ATPase [Nonomuraea thailandensis]MCP2354692.1 DNA-binding SARP family transcriptional activator [Nonomuraea thailandensis]